MQSDLTAPNDEGSLEGALRILDLALLSTLTAGGGTGLTQIFLSLLDPVDYANYRTCAM